MKVYEVYYINNYMNNSVIGRFSTPDKAKKFINDCKEVFYIGIVKYDYRGYEFEIEEYDLDEFDNIEKNNE